MRKILVLTLALALVMCLATSSMAAFTSRATVSSIKARATVNAVDASLSAVWKTIDSTTKLPTTPLQAGDPASFGSVSPTIADPNAALEVTVGGNLFGWGVALYVQNYNAANNTFVALPTVAADDLSTPLVNEYQAALKNASKGLVLGSDGKQTANMRWIATPTVATEAWPSANTAYRSADAAPTAPSLALSTMWNDQERGWKWMMDFSSENTYLNDLKVNDVKDDPADPYGARGYATFMNALNASEFTGSKAYVYFLANFTGATAGAYGTDTLTLEYYTE